MKLFEKFNLLLGFTPSEGKIILVLVGSFILGWGIKNYRQSELRDKAFDYSAVDSEFQARSIRNIPPDSASSDSDGGRFRTRVHLPKPGTKIDLNSATKDELIGLPGIGDVMAERIILYREDHGPFKQVEELVKVRGIGKKKLERLIPLCTTVE